MCPRVTQDAKFSSALSEAHAKAVRDAAPGCKSSRYRLLWKEEFRWAARESIASDAKRRVPAARWRDLTMGRGLPCSCRRRGGGPPRRRLEPL